MVVFEIVFVSWKVPGVSMIHEILLDIFWSRFLIFVQFSSLLKDLDYESIRADYESMNHFGISFNLHFYVRKCFNSDYCFLHYHHHRHIRFLIMVLYLSHQMGLAAPGIVELQLSVKYGLAGHCG